MAGAELKQLRQFVADKAVDRLPEYETDICDGVGYHYVHMGKRGGSRLLMNNPPEGEDLCEIRPGGPGRVYGELVQLFKRLADPDKLSIIYLNRRILPDLEVMYPSETRDPGCVGSGGGGYSRSPGCVRSDG